MLPGGGGGVGWERGRCVEGGEGVGKGEGGGGNRVRGSRGRWGIGGRR